MVTKGTYLQAEPEERSGEIRVIVPMSQGPSAPGQQPVWPWQLLPPTWYGQRPEGASASSHAKELGSQTLAVPMGLLETSVQRALQLGRPLFLSAEILALRFPLFIIIGRTESMCKAALLILFLVSILQIPAPAFTEKLFNKHCTGSICVLTVVTCPADIRSLEPGPLTWLDWFSSWPGGFSKARNPASPAGAQDEALADCSLLEPPSSLSLALLALAWARGTIPFRSLGLAWACPPLFQTND
ncbi:hypothetical protein H8959_004893 [Pygathrix nigripes]